MPVRTRKKAEGGGNGSGEHPPARARQLRQGLHPVAEAALAPAAALEEGLQLVSEQARAGLGRSASRSAIFSNENGCL